MNVRLGSVAFVLLANAVATCVADEAADVSVCFVPGDAFFSISQRDLASPENENDDGSVTFSYQAPPTVGSTITSAHINALGFCQISVEGMDVSELESLRLLSEMVSKETRFQKRDESEVRDGSVALSASRYGFPVLIVNRDFAIEKGRSLLRLNEDWMSVPAQYQGLDSQARGDFSSLGFGVYRPFLKQRRFIVDDWKNAKEVSGLKCVYPDRITIRMRETEAVPVRGVAEAIRVQASDVMFLAFPGKYHHGGDGPDGLYSTVYVEYGAVIRRYRWVYDALHGKKHLVLESILDLREIDVQLSKRQWRSPIRGEN